MSSASESCRARMRAHVIWDIHNARCIQHTETCTKAHATCTHTYTNIHMHTHAYIHTYINTHNFTHIHTYIHTLRALPP